MSAMKTAWHPPFTGLLQERGPRWAKVSGEVQLSVEPSRVDDVIEVWADRPQDPTDVGTTLRGMWRYVVVVALVEFKSVVWPFQPGDLFRLVGYGMQWLVAHQRREMSADGSRSERLAAHEVTLVLAVPSINQTLRDALGEMDLALPPSETGYYVLATSGIPLVVIDLGVVAKRENDDVLRWFAGTGPRTLDGQQWVRQHSTKQGEDMNNMATPDLYGYDEWERRLVQTLTPEQRLEGLSTEQRLLALPDEALRALSEDYVATLDPATQATIRARRGT